MATKERKLTRRNYSNALEFGIKDGRFQSATGLIDTQNIEDVIRDLVNDIPEED